MNVTMHILPAFTFAASMAFAVIGFPPSHHLSQASIPEGPSLTNAVLIAPGGEVKMDIEYPKTYEGVVNAVRVCARSASTQSFDAPQCSAMAEAAISGWPADIPAGIPAAAADDHLAPVEALVAVKTYCRALWARGVERGVQPLNSPVCEDVSPALAPIH